MIGNIIEPTPMPNPVDIPEHVLEMLRKNAKRRRLLRFQKEVPLPERKFRTYSRFTASIDDIDPCDWHPVEQMVMRPGLDPDGWTIGELFVRRIFGLARPATTFRLSRDGRWLERAHGLADWINGRMRRRGYPRTAHRGTTINWWSALDADDWNMDWDLPFREFVEFLLQPLDEDEERSKFYRHVVAAEEWERV